MSHASRHPADLVEPPPKPAADLQVSTYDRVAGMLVALIILIGFLVLILFLLWLTNRVFARQQAVPVELLEEIAGRGDRALGSARDLEPPGLEELPDLTEPTLADTLESVTEAISTELATLEALEGDSDLTGRGRGGGDSRQPGPGGEGSNIIPRGERWEIRFGATTLENYAQQLDYFGIELGAVGGGETIQYAYHLAKPKPDTKTGRSTQEKRLYMSWRRGELQEADRTLLVRAGINTKNRIILQFYPPNIEQLLAQAEKQRAGARGVKEIRRTVFGVKSLGADYEFYVTDQEYRLGP